MSNIKNNTIYLKRIKEKTSKKENNTDAEKEKTAELEEIGGQKGPDPTRYGDWEKNGRVSDF